MTGVGVVVIGRNEQDRLGRCLDSVRGHGCPVFYVDSGSIDGSVSLARRAGVEIVELDPSIPFTVTRARNEGLRRLLELHPGTEYVQFVDADSQLAAGWLERARRELQSRRDVGAVDGRLRERFPRASIYNRLRDIEWNTPVGETDACVGTLLVRVEAFEQVGGYNAGIIGGSDPEFCFRLRRAGWKLVRLDEEMGLSDSAMLRFAQWWKRSIRDGHSYAEAVALHGLSSWSFGLRHSLGIWFWGVALPAAALATARPTRMWSLILLGGYPLQVARIAARRLRRGDPWREGWLFSTFCMLSKWPQLLGQALFLSHRLLGGHATLIEYSQAGTGMGAADAGPAGAQGVPREGGSHRGGCPPAGRE